jgi:hypothetical protein
MANSSENLKGIEVSELAAFELGVTLGKVDRLLCWLTKTRRYDPGLATWLFERGTIPDDHLNPYQGIPIPFVRAERSRFLVEIQKACYQFSTMAKGMATALELTGSNDVPQMAKLFDRLDKLEEERFYENLKWLPSEQQEDARTDFEGRRSYLQESIKRLASSIQLKISTEQKTLPQCCFSMLRFGVHLESLKYAYSDSSESITEFSSQRKANWVTFAQKYVSRAAASCHRLQELTPVMWVDSGLSFDQQISNLIEQVRRVLETVPPEVIRERKLKHAYPRKSEVSEPEDPDGWEEFAKEKIILCGTEINLPHQRKLVLIRLLFEEGRWLTAGDLSAVDHSWRESDDKRQGVSAVVTKMEKELAQQLNISRTELSSNDLRRPVQRSLGSERTAQYRIEVSVLEQLVREG